MFFFLQSIFIIDLFPHVAFLFVHLQHKFVSTAIFGHANIWGRTKFEYWESSKNVLKATGTWTSIICIRHFSPLHHRVCRLFVIRIPCETFRHWKACNKPHVLMLYCGQEEGALHALVHQTFRNTDISRMQITIYTFVKTYKRGHSNQQVFWGFS